MANIKKNAQGYGYKYTDLAAINDYIESIGETYYQEVERIEGDDYIVTVRQRKEADSVHTVNEKIRGCRVVQASLSGKVNPAQEQGSGLTYARRYSLLMAYGLATEDDDGESLTLKKERKANIDTTTSGADQEIAARNNAKIEMKDPLDQAKIDINEELINQGYNTSDAKRGFIRLTLGKELIETIDEARDVANALEANTND